ncbi:MAG: exodeoxyribonuclease VII large subunit [Omnitrophica bacterium]|nr:exodeoxyribonuclease VII large subunit [Candidatus Omnitrophota bacterium]
MNQSSQSDKIYTVSELNNRVNDLLREEFPNYIWVCGEIQDFRASKDRRHIYFSLVQKHRELSQIIAKVNAAIFERSKHQVLERLKEAKVTFELKDDIEVKFLCEVSLYPKTGNFSIIVVDVDPIYTLGKIAQSRQQIIEDLRKRGLLQKNKQTNIPLVPLKIGLITAHGSAAYHDFINELSTSSYGFKVSVYNCHMQGKLVENDIIRALRFFNSLPTEKLEVVVITRGGGSTADLSYFDNKKIAETVANLKFPVISALGHQINISISDMVAHTSCKTPTKGAQLLIEKVREFAEKLDFLEAEIAKITKNFMLDRRKTLQNITMTLDSMILRYFQIHREELLDKKHSILNASKVLLTRQKEHAKRQYEGLKLSLTKIFKHNKDSLEYIKGKLNILDPKNTLRRGYSITFKNKKALKSIDDTKENDIIKTLLYEGSLTSRVIKEEA